MGDLPGLDELKGAGLLEGNLPPGFAVPMPSDDTTLRDDEDPLEPGDLDLGLAPPSAARETNVSEFEGKYCRRRDMKATLQRQRKSLFLPLAEPSFTVKS